MDSNYLKELEEEIQKRKAEADLQFNQVKLNSQKKDSKNSNVEENSNHQSDIEQENNIEQEQEQEEEIENNLEEEEDNDIVNEGIKSLTDENKEENNLNFEIKEEKNGENINYEIQDINEPKTDSNFGNFISMNKSGICQCCNKEFDNKQNVPCLLKCNHIFCKICLETYFTEKEGIKCPIDGLVGKDLNDVQIVNSLIENKEKSIKKNKKGKNKIINKKKKEIKNELNLDINNNIDMKNIKNKNLQNLDYNIYNDMNDINDINNNEQNENVEYKEEYDENNNIENISNTNNENENENEKIKDFNEIQIRYSDKLEGSKKSSKKNHPKKNKIIKSKDNRSNASNQNINISNLNNNNNINDQDNNENMEESPEQDEYNQNYCNIHPEQKITHFVEDTKELICIHCAFNKLKNNPTIQIKEISEKCKEYLNDLDIIIDNNQKYSQLIQNSLNDINENKENEEKKIIEIYEQLLNLLVTNRNNFLIKIEEIYQENTGNMNKKLENFAEIIDIAEKLKEDFEVIAEQAPYEFNHLTQAFNKFIRDMNDKSKSDLDIMQYNFSHDELNKVLKYLNNFSDVKTRKKCYRFDFLKSNGSQNYSIKEITNNQNNNNFNDNFINRNINDNNVFNNGINKYYKASKQLKYIDFSNSNHNFIPNNQMSNNFNNSNNQNSLLEGSNNNMRFNFKYDDKEKNNKTSFNGNLISESINNTLNKYIIPNNNYKPDDFNNKNSLKNLQNSGNIENFSNSNSGLQSFKNNDKLAILNKYKIPNKAKK